MASFDGSDDRELVRYPLRRVEPMIRRYIKVLRIDLERLRKHKSNIDRLQDVSDSAQLNKEQVNANTTVHQINSTLRQLECTRSQIQLDDVAAFDRQVKEIYKEAVSAVEHFLSFHNQEILDSKTRPPPLSDLKACSLPDEHYLGGESSAAYSSVGLEVGSQQVQLRVDESAPSQDYVESWHDLQGSLSELNGLVHEYASLVEGQQETVDHLEDNIETAQVNVSEGTKSLSQAAKLKAALFPVAGAVLGGALGGPVGLVAGMKLGGLAAVSGGLIGFTGGSFWKRRQQKINEVELANMSHKKSQSLPEISSDTQVEPLYADAIT